MFVIVLTYKKPISEVDSVRPAHLKYLDRFYAKDIFILSGRQVSPEGGAPTGGVIIASAPSRDSVTAIMEEDPFIKEGIADYEIIQFDANRYHGALEGLIRR